MCKREKAISFTHFFSKIAHINGSIILFICKTATVTVLKYTVIVTLHFNILLIFSLTIKPVHSLSLHSSTSSLLLHLSLSLSLQLINPSTHYHNPAPSNHHHHNITIQNNPTSKSTKKQTHTHTHTHTLIETERVLLQTCGCGSVLGGQLEHVLVLVKEVGVYGLIGTVSVLNTTCGDRCLWQHGVWIVGEAVWLWGREGEVI